MPWRETAPVDERSRFIDADLHTRYLLECRGLRSTRTMGAQAVFERLFRAYGLPRAIRTDNGVPFATTGLHGRSTLSVWWIHLGIQPQRIRPATRSRTGRTSGCTRRSSAARSARRDAGGAAARLRPVPGAVQHGASPQDVRRPDAGLALPPLAAAVPRPAAGDRVPRTLPGPRESRRRGRSASGTDCCS